MRLEQRMILWVGLACTAHSATALAQDSAAVTEARTVFEAADVHFERGEYAQALAGFERAHELMAGHRNQALILFNIARTNEELGRSHAAAEAYRAFLEQTSPDVEYRADAMERLRELELREQLELDDRRRGGGGPGMHPLGPVLLAIGGAIALSGVATGAVALASDSDIASTCDSGGRCPASERSNAADTQTLANVTDVLLFGGAAIAVAGLVLTLVLRESDSRAPAVTAFCGAEGCLVRVGGSL